MSIGIDIIYLLYKFDLGLLKKDNNMYCLYELTTKECYEEMTIYYIISLLKNWYKYHELNNSI